MSALSDPLTSVLRSGREVFNNKFAEARRRYPELEADVFSEFLRSTLDPVVREAKLSSEVLPNFVLAAYDTALELTGERLTGNDARGRVLEETWQRLVPKALPFSAAAFERLLAALSNAVINLSGAPRVRVKPWIEQMEKLLPRCSDLDALLKVGQVLAWRAGMAHYRTSALDVAATLPAPLACFAVGANEDASWPDLLQHLAEDPWFDPGEPKLPEGQMRPARRAGKAGAFRGLGGNFTQPPIVAAEDGQLYVSSGEECWSLVADRFGYTLHRAEATDFNRATFNTAGFESLKISSDKIVIKDQTLAHAMPGEVTSFALLPHTLALTSSFTHEVALIAY